MSFFITVIIFHFFYLISYTAHSAEQFKKDEKVSLSDQDSIGRWSACRDSK